MLPQASVHLHCSLQIFELRRVKTPQCAFHMQYAIWRLFQSSLLTGIALSMHSGPNEELSAATHVGGAPDSTAAHARVRFNGAFSSRALTGDDVKVTTWVLRWAEKRSAAELLSKARRHTFGWNRIWHELQMPWKGCFQAVAARNHSCDDKGNNLRANHYFHFYSSSCKAYEVCIQLRKSDTDLRCFVLICSPQHTELEFSRFRWTKSALFSIQTRCWR